jgi:predicted CopG family antitoxin
MTSYTITVPDEIWEKFKKIINKSLTFNDAIVELIKKEVEKKK